MNTDKNSIELESNPRRDFLKNSLMTLGVGAALLGGGSPSASAVNGNRLTTIRKVTSNASARFIVFPLKKSIISNLVRWIKFCYNTIILHLKPVLVNLSARRGWSLFRRECEINAFVRHTRIILLHIHCDVVADKKFPGYFTIVGERIGICPVATLYY